MSTLGGWRYVSLNIYLQYTHRKTLIFVHLGEHVGNVQLVLLML